ncbi:MAG: PEP-CTERM sorting domain-containing protein [Phycisphaerales bacterium]|nr:PEP-CTERM sorting domain-containing protein [Phycisphaerales bacterium]
MRKLAFVVLATFVAGPASAGLFQDVYNGLDLLATPTGAPVFTSATGFHQNGSRIGRVRVVPQQLGRGWDLEFDRNFGPDSGGRPEIFDLGGLELQLAGNISATAGYTKRGFLIGTMSSSINQLQYDFRGTTGAQDFSLNGILNGTSNLEINQFGFYDLSLDLSNQSSRLNLDGLVIDDGQPLDGLDTDYDIGPINIKGNIFIDALAGLASSLGADTSAIAAVFPESPIDQIGNQIKDALQRAADEAAASIVAGEVQADVASAEGVVTINDQSGAAIVPVPEPATLVLLALGALALGRRR